MDAADLLLGDSGASPQPSPTATSDDYVQSLGFPLGFTPKGEHYEALVPAIEDASKETGVPANLIRGVVWKESMFHPDVVYGKKVGDSGDSGAMQLIPPTAKAMGVKNVFDPAYNIMGGAKYLASLHDELGDWSKAAAAYNSGGAHRFFLNNPDASAEQAPNYDSYVRPVLSAAYKFGKNAVAPTEAQAAETPPAKVSADDLLLGNATLPDQPAAAPADQQPGKVSADDLLKGTTPAPAPQAIPPNAPDWAKDHPDAYWNAVKTINSLDMPGDMAALTAGAKIGATGGAALAAPTVVGAPVGALAGGVAGAGLAYAIKQYGMDAVKQYLGMDKPYDLPEGIAKGIGNVMSGATMEAGGGVVGKGLEVAAAGVGKAVSLPASGIRKYFGSIENPVSGLTPGQLAEDYSAFGLDPMAGALTQNKATQGLQNALAKMGGSAKVIQEQADANLAKLGDKVQGIAESFTGSGPEDLKANNIKPSGEQLGDFVLNKAAEIGDRFKTTAGRVFSNVDSRIGDLPAKADNLQAWIDDRASQLSPEAATNFRKLVSKWTDPILQDAAAAPPPIKVGGQTITRDTNPGLYDSIVKSNPDLASGETGGGLNFRSLRYWRTQIDEKLGNPLIADTDTATRGMLKQIRNQITADMDASATEGGPEAIRAFKGADAWYSQQKDVMGRIEKLVGSGDVDRIGNAVLNPSVPPQSLRALRTKMDPEDWDVVSGTIFSKLGIAKPGAQNVAGDVFSPNTFMTNWSKLSPEAKQVLWGGTRYSELTPELDRVARVSASMKDAASMANTSNTAPVGMWMRLIGGLGTAGYGTMTGNKTMEGMGAGVAGSVVAPYAVAKLMTNPRFVGWLARTGEDMLSQPTVQATQETLSKSFGRLVTVAKGNPNIGPDVYSYLHSLSDSAKQEQNPSEPMPVAP
jgi:hypothetical protein